MGEKPIIQQFSLWNINVLKLYPYLTSFRDALYLPLVLQEFFICKVYCNRSLQGNITKSSGYVAEMVTASSLFLSSSSVRVIVINQNCQKTGQFLADPQFFKADTPFFRHFFAAGLFLPYLICILTLPVM